MYRKYIGALDKAPLAPCHATCCWSQKQASRGLSAATTTTRTHIQLNSDDCIGQPWHSFPQCSAFQRLVWPLAAGLLVSNIVPSMTVCFAVTHVYFTCLRRSTVVTPTGPLGHVLVGLTFGGLGYGAHQWDIRASEILAEKRAEIAARRQRQIERIEAQGQAVLAEHAQHS